MSKVLIETQGGVIVNITSTDPSITFYVKDWDGYSEGEDTLNKDLQPDLVVSEGDFNTLIERNCHGST